MTNREAGGARAAEATGIVVALVLASILAGCGGTGSASSDGPTRLLGEYKTVLPASPPPVQNPAGRWGFVVTSETEAWLVPPRGPSFPAGNPVHVTQGEITFAADPACPVQKIAGKGRYRWNVDGSSLSFTEIDDPCRDRALLLTSRPWTRARVLR